MNQVSKHPILIDQIVYSSFPGIIKNISKSNFSRVDVECYDGKGANKIAESNKTLINHNLKTFIHNYRVSREGIIRDIPLEIEIDDIIRYASTNLKCPVLSDCRFLSKKDNEELTPSTTIQIRFDGQAVPDYVYLFHLRIKFQSYITQPKICFKCYRFGHVANQCKKPRCRFCGEDPHERESTCLDSALGTSNSNIHPSYASKTSKPKSPRKSPQSKTQTQPTLPRQRSNLGSTTPPFSQPSLSPSRRRLEFSQVNHSPQSSPLPYRILTYHTYLYNLYLIFCLFFHNYSTN